MKKIVLLAAMVALLFVGFTSCGQKNKQTQEEIVANDVHNSQNSLDWKGTYIGITPCADCEGISVHITLNDDAYQATYLYLGKENVEPIQFSGKFSWNDAGSIITLEGTDFPPHFKVGENTLTQLDMDGNLITGEHANMYVLIKSME